MRNKKNGIQMAGIVILVTVIFVLAVLLCSSSVKDSLSEEVKDSLEEVAEQNEVSVEQEMTANFKLLKSLSKQLTECSDEEIDTFSLEKMKKFVEEYDLKRMGFIKPDGTVRTTDGYTKNLSYREFFKQGMKGKAYISDCLIDSIGTIEKINVFSVPVYDENQKVKGVLFATYRTESFTKTMFTSPFEGKGYNYLINSKGDIIAYSGKKGMRNLKNVFTFMNGKREQDSFREEKMRKDMKNKKKGTDIQYNDIDEFFYSYIPVKLDEVDLDWYILSVVPSNVLSEKMTPVMNDINLLVCVIIFAGLAAMLFYVYNGQKVKKELYKLAYEDPVTKGDNFEAFKEKAKGKEKVLGGYLLAMDLSEFKLINSTCGNEKGDEVLREIWNILEQDLKNQELAARVNGDRFVLYWIEESREYLIERMNKVICEIEELPGKMDIPRLFPLFGIYPTNDLNDVDKYYGNARRAKLLIKGRRDRHYIFFEELDFEQIVENRRLEDEFESALKNDRFEVWYQPKYNAFSKEIIGSEALVRWRDKDGTMISPGKFIPLFEKNGDIIKLDEYVFRKVCLQQMKWKAEGKEILPVSVNISRVSLYYSNVVEKYVNIINEVGIKPKYVELEITESATIDNVDVSDLIEQFHAAGFKILLDDFGSGYSSLSTLNEMHFDTIKLDKSLIDFIGNERGEKMLNSITKLAQSLGMEITAEGVETGSQLEFLCNIKCEDIQGYYFSKPLPKDEFESHL